MTALEEMGQLGYVVVEMDVSDEPPGVIATWRHRSQPPLRTFSQGRPASAADARDFLEQYRTEAAEGHARLALTLLNDVDPAQTGPTQSRSTDKPIE